jgi:hypothetical protein
MVGWYVRGGGYLLPTESAELSLFAYAAAAATAVALLVFFSSSGAGSAFGVVCRGVVGLCVALGAVLDRAGGAHKRSKAVNKGFKPCSMLLLRDGFCAAVKLSGQCYERIDLIL